MSILHKTFLLISIYYMQGLLYIFYLNFRDLGVFNATETRNSITTMTQTNVSNRIFVYHQILYIIIRKASFRTFDLCVGA